MTALNADKWLYTKLTTDATLITALGGRVYADTAPQGVGYPFAVITAISSLPIANVSADRVMDTELWQVALWTNAPSYNGLEAIADRIRTVLHKASGTGVIGAVYEGMRRMEEREGDVVYKVLILEFRIYTQ